MSRRTRRLPGLAAVPLLIVLVGCGVGLAREESGTLPVAPPAAQTSLVSSLPSGFVHETVFGGLFLPTAVAFLPNGAILIATKPGLVYLYVDGALAEAPLLDISDRVNDFVDRGLLSLAVDPDFETNGYLYLLYTFDADPEDYEGAKVSRLGRFTVEGRLASPASEVVLLGTAGTESCSSVAAGADCLPSDGRSHTVGDLQFASDGSIFLTVGDGASDVLVNDDPFRAQDLDLLAGKLLRITKEGKGLPDNPFWNGDADANRSKVWASGLRNAYRFHLQPGTDQPFLGDVGEGAWEEINAPSAGANLGWPCYEGPVLQARYESHDDCRALYAAGTEVTFPVLSVGHEGAARAITAGPFYAGVTFPAAFHGAMFFGDVIEGSIDFILVNGENELVDGPIRFFDGADGADGPVDIAVGPDGSLYYVSIFTGEVRRIRYLAPPPHQPVVLGDHAWSAASNGSDAITVDARKGPAGSMNGLTVGGVSFERGPGDPCARRDPLRPQR